LGEKETSQVALPRRQMRANPSAIAESGESMKKPFQILIGIFLFAPVCHAQARWCAVTGHAANDKLLYPPIARAARVSGVVIGRMTYLPSGQVTNLETISGPIMLQRAVSDQLKKWTIHTDAQGEDPCMSLAIVDFSFGDSASVNPNPPTSAGIMRISIVTETLDITDAAATLGKRHWWSRK
jgi:Gram-negative bacterial TonB protein C-terminal